MSNISYGDSSNNTDFVLGSGKSVASLVLNSTGVLRGTVAVGEAIVVYISVNGTTAISTVVDSVGNVYLKKIVGNNGTTARIEIWATIVTSPITPGATLTVTPSATATIAVATEVYSGVVSFGNTASQGGTGNGPAVNVATQNPNNWVAAGVAFTGIATVSAGVSQGSGNFRHSTGTSGGSASTNSGVGTNDNSTLYPGATLIQGAPASLANILSLSVNETNIMAGVELCAPSAVGQPFYTYMCGFETGNVLFEASRTIVGSPIASSTIVHGGKYSMRCNPTNAKAYIEIQQVQNQIQTPFACSLRFYMYVAVLPSVTTTIHTGVDINSISFYQDLLLNPDGTMTIEDGVGVKVQSTQKLTTGAWHQISFAVDPRNTSNSITLYVDGTQWATLKSTPTNTTVYAIMRIGVGISENVTCDVYFDDIIFESGANGPINVGPGQQVLLLPTSDVSIGGWTGGLGGVTNLNQALDNIPPKGRVPPGFNNTQIRNVSAGPSDYTASCQSYAAAGVPPNASLNAVASFTGDSTEVAGTLFGLLWLASNPIQSVPTALQQFTFGLGATEGAFPTGWQADQGPVTTNPQVSLSSPPKVTLRKLSTAVAAATACFLGVYCDYNVPQVFPDGMKVFWMG